MEPIYMDNAASTPVKSEVLDKFNEVAKKLYGNPSSQHMAGFEARREVNNAKMKIANALNCKDNEIFFTSGATMSNNILIQGVLRKNPEWKFVTSSVEHNDIMELYNWLPYEKMIIDVPKKGEGRIWTDEFYLRLDKIKSRPFLVSIQIANSETGVIQPIKPLARIVHGYGGYLHVDATQYIPYYPIDVNKVGIDALSMSGQKIGGLKGSGLLYVSEELQEKMTPVIFGEQGLIGGTYATPLISSIATAIEYINYDISDLEHKRDVLLEGLEELGGILVGSRKHRLPNNIYIRFPGVNGLKLMNLLNDRDIYIGTGSACSTDSDKPSHVALAYGLTEEKAFECVRFTLSDNNTYEEIEYVLKTLSSLLRFL